MDKEKYREQAKVLFGKKQTMDKSRQDKLKVQQRTAQIRANRPIVDKKIIHLSSPLPRKPKPGTIGTKKQGCSGCARKIIKKK